MSQPAPRRNPHHRPAPRRLHGAARPASMALLAMGGVLMVYAQAVAALGVGEPRYLSHLFEPLHVDIPVDTRGVDPAAVRVGVSLSGGDPASLSAVAGQLKREWRTDEHGGHVLRVTAPQAIHEPMLQMRVEVGDARIQAVRDLTLLFDPAPVAMAGPVEPVVEASASAPMPLVAEATAPRVAPAAALEAAAVAPIAELAEARAAVAAEPVAEVAGDEVDAATVLRAIEAELEDEARLAATPAAGDAASLRLAPLAPLTVAAVPATGVGRIAPARPVAVTPDSRSAPAAVPVERPERARAPAVTISVRPLAAPAPVPAIAALATLTLPVLGAAERRAQIASTLEPRALSAIDRWQRVRVAEGDTLESLALRVRGEHAEIPLPMVAMLLRWLNPRSFEQSVGAPLPGAELRFPNPDSLAAQIAVSGGVWTVDDLTSNAGAVAAVPPPSFQLLTALSAESLDRTLKAATATDDRAPDAAAAIAALGTGLAVATPPAAPRLRLSGGLVGGAALAGVLSMLLMLNMVLRTPLPQGPRALAGAVVARSVSAAPATAADSRVLPGESLDLAALDLGASADALHVRRAAVGERAES